MFTHTCTKLITVILKHALAEHS